MTPKKRLVIDLNSLANTALLGGKDHENGVPFFTPEGKETLVNSATYGAERFAEKFAAVLTENKFVPIDVIGVWDGRGAKMYRRNFLPQYKEGRDKQDAVYEQFNALKELVNQFLYGLGATVAEQNGSEADDTIAYLCEHLTSENYILTSDGDLAVLVNDKTHILRNGDVDVNPYGPFPHNHITTYKALVGDTSDKIPGAKGFGDAAFVNLVALFGVEGLDAMSDLIATNKVHELKDDVQELPALQKVIDNQEAVYNSWRAAKLYPNRVNTLNQPLKLVPGMVSPVHTLPEVMQLPEVARWCQRTKLVSVENYEASLKHFTHYSAMRGELALDLETSTPPESDDWLEMRGKKGKAVDVQGSQLTGFSMTYGDNLQYTFYATVDHVPEAGVTNLTLDQAAAFFEAIPEETTRVIHNRAFEFNILYRTWGRKWKGNGWYGFVPNAIDSAVAASYVNENESRGLKHWSRLALNYQQTDYDTVTQGRKMNQMTAREVLSYGCDDTICTAAIMNYFRIVMELEHTWDVYMQVEQLPEYLTSLAMAEGLNYSPSHLHEMEKEDKEKFDKLLAEFTEYLKKHGWGCSEPPHYEEITPAALKETYLAMTGQEFTSRKRKLEALAAELRELGTIEAGLLANVVEQNDVATLNRLAKKHFKEDLGFNFDSTRHKQRLLYEVMGVTPRLLNPLTDKQRENHDMAQAMRLYRDWKKNPKMEVSADVRKVWVEKAKTDDDAIELALYAENNLEEEHRQALKIFGEVRTLQTRFKMFYQPYHSVAHWSDGKLHPQMIQCQAATRRYASADPNIQQLPARGEGIKFREIILPHHKDAVVVSMDFSGQELRIMADYCKDANMLSCYIGDNKRDIHSLISIQAAPSIWGETITYEEFMRMRKKGTPEEQARASALRDGGKMTNFATQYGAGAAKVAIQLKATEETAQKFIDAKSATFPGIDLWKEKYEAQAHKVGYATTKLGARRHLRNTLQSDDKYEVMRGERQASNYAIQGSGGEMAKLAMASMWRSGIFTGRFDARWMFPVHDEVVFSVHKNQAHEVIEIAHACMIQQYADMTVPLESEIAIGRDFGRMDVVGTEPNAERTKEIIDKLFEGE